MVRNCDSKSSLIDQNPFLASSLEKNLASENLCVFIVGVLEWHHMIAQFRSLRDPWRSLPLLGGSLTEPAITASVQILDGACHYFCEHTLAVNPFCRLAYTAVAERTSCVWIHTFPKGISLKVIVIARLEFELTHYDVVVQHVSHFATSSLPY